MKTFSRIMDFLAALVFYAALGIAIAVIFGGWWLGY